MLLITKEIQNLFDKQGDTSELEMKDIKIVCKLFNPVGAATWYLYEQMDEDVYYCFADLGDPMCAEIGTVSMNEMKSLKLPMGMSIERDTSFKGGVMTLEEIYNKVKGH